MRSSMQTWMRTFFALAASCASAWTLQGCSVFDPPLSTDGGTSDASDSSVDPNCMSDLKVNELDGELQDGSSFIEIFNAGSQDLDMSGFLIAEESVGEPDLADAIEVPSGFVLDSGRFLYVWAGLLELGGVTIEEGLTDTCIAGAPTPCMHAPWGVSNSGETIFLLDRTRNRLCQLRYPESRPSDSFGRFPDGSATTATTVPTPGEANQEVP